MATRRRSKATPSALVRIFALAAATAGPALSQVTTRASLGADGSQGNQQSFGSSISADGRFVVFRSLANNLVPGDTNDDIDLFVRDRWTGTTERVSVDSAGVQANADSGIGSISGDGRYVAFGSAATNLVPGDTNGVSDVFVRDRQNGTTTRVSVDANGVEGDGPSGSGYRDVAISADGRFVVFDSGASNLVPGDTNGTFDVFVRDLQIGTIERTSVGPGGVEGNGVSSMPVISADGRYVAFVSDATNLVPNDTNDRTDHFVRDRLAGTTERVNVDSNGVPANAGSNFPSLSGNGRFVVFDSDATNLVPGDTNGVRDTFVHDRTTGTTERVSVRTDGSQALRPSGAWWPSVISADGRFVVFHSEENLDPAHCMGFAFHVYVHDRQTGVTEIASTSSSWTEPHTYSIPDAISPDGRFIAFSSGSALLVPGDTNGWMDVFVRDLDPDGFASFCEPGVGGVITCPCSNPPSGPGRGCDTSVGTGGATLSASGVAYLSMDTLVFTTSGERASALSTLLQGTSVVANGVVYGQGVRCVAGALKRLYSKSASAGSITAPDFVAGDPTVSARSAAKGDPIAPGQSRYYLVYYRDPIVLGGCPAASTFNASTSGRISWSP